MKAVVCEAAMNGMFEWHVSRGPTEHPSGLIEPALECAAAEAIRSGGLIRSLDQRHQLALTPQLDRQRVLGEHVGDELRVACRTVVGQQAELCTVLLALRAVVDLCIATALRERAKCRGNNAASTAEAQREAEGWPAVPDSR